MQNKNLNRLNLLKDQLFGTKTSNLNQGKYPLNKSQDDIVIVSYARTALAKAGRGSFKDTQPEVLTKAVIKGCIDRSKVDPKDIQEIVFGNVLGVGSNFIKVRMSQFLAGLSDKTTFMAVNRLCSSGLQAVMNLAHSIAAGQVEIGIAGGVEVMSQADMNNSVDPESISEEVFEVENARNCMIPMGITSENVAEKFGVTRKEQDEFAVESHRRAVLAQKNGLFDKEIVPVTTSIKEKDGSLKTVTVTKDEGARETTIESLQKLKAAFKKDGTTSAGNSSQVTDGAAAVLLMKRSTAEKKGIKILGRILGYAVEGVAPEIMGIGPAAAIPAVLKKTGLTTDEIDIYELNEAFASQAVFCVKKLGLKPEKVNPKGGAIALGHPLGCTGARLICTLFNELERTNKKTGIVSMCIGTGMGAAAVFERE
jgi:acetyl-CoA acyltransferase 1